LYEVGGVFQVLKPVEEAEWPKQTR